MVSLKAQLLATILLLSEVYSQLAGGGYPQPQRGASVTPSMVRGGHFVVPAVIHPLIPARKPEAPAQPAPKKQGSVGPYPPVPCADDLDDSELDKLVHLLMSNIIENKKGSGKKQSSTNNFYDSNAGSSACDAYDACACSYGEDYDYCSYSAPAAYSSSSSGGGDGYCPEISVFIRPYNDS